MLNRTPRLGFKRFLHFTQGLQGGLLFTVHQCRAAVICTLEFKVHSRLFSVQIFFSKLTQLLPISTWRHRDSVQAVELVWVHQQHIADLHSLFACELSVTLSHETDFCSKIWVDGMTWNPEMWNFEKFALGFWRSAFFQQRVKPDVMKNWTRILLSKSNLATPDEAVQHGDSDRGVLSEATYLSQIEPWEWVGKKKEKNLNLFSLNYLAKDLFTKHA